MAEEIKIKVQRIADDELLEECKKESSRCTLAFLYTFTLKTQAY